MPGFEFHCEGVYGLTGSGKTTFAMMRAFEASCAGLHVYTNIDFDTAALRHHLLRRHAHNYRDNTGNIPRLHRRWTHIEDDQVSNFWRYLDRTTGPSLVLIDEAHLWFPQTKQHREESDEFTKYLSQHRKLRHHVMFVSQFDTLVSHSFRKQQHIHWEVRNARQLGADLGFFRFRLPFEGFSYTGFYRDKSQQRIDGRVILTCFPWNKWVWDLFRTIELHAGLDNLLQGQTTCTD